MKTIRASVNARLLSKASRLFTGSVEGRVIEILQNARRAGATEVHITNKEGTVTVRDNGRGIEDFSRLLDLGGSGWEDTLEASEDPAGVGVFCLAPREVTIRSNGKVVTIKEDGWTGEPVSVLDDPARRCGTLLEFDDEEWNSSAVDLNAVFAGIKVVVDGRECPSVPFTSDGATHYRDLGCRIEVCTSQDLSPWHHTSFRTRWYGHNALINFHGQVVSCDVHPISEHGLRYLIDMTGEPTGIRLMLPARTQMLENEAFAKLKGVLEIEAFRFVQRRGHHRLPYKEFTRAEQLGINLPEATPTYSVGLLATDEAPEPIEVTMPKDLPLGKCYRFNPDQADGNDSDEANVHILAALGRLDQPFVPVNINKSYDGYSWADLPTVIRVELSVGRELLRDGLWSGTLSCVDMLAIKVHTSDGHTITSPVCLAVAPEPHEKAPAWANDHVLVTPLAQEQLCASEIWHHLGGWSDEGDTYDTQSYQFEEELERFWMQLVGPDEQLRRNIIRTLEGIQPAWNDVSVSRDGTVHIEFEDGTVKYIAPPTSPATDTSE